MSIIHSLITFLVCLQISYELEISEYCNLTACEALDICRKEITLKKIVDTEENNDIRLIKLERILRSLEQPGKVFF